VLETKEQMGKILPLIIMQNNRPFPCQPYRSTA
jgi:hypothetical protein